MDAEQRVRTFIIEGLGWSGSAQDLTSDYQLIDNDVLDSMGIFETVTFLEGQFGIEIDDDELVPENFESLGAIARLVAAKTPS